MMLPMLQWIKPLVLFFAYGVEKQENKKVTIGDISNPAPCLSPFCLPDHIEMPRSASLYPKKVNIVRDGHYP
jgi:hypothetical protein